MANQLANLLQTTEIYENQSVPPTDDHFSPKNFQTLGVTFILCFQSFSMTDSKVRPVW